MIRRLLAAAACLVVVGCGATPVAPTQAPSLSATVAASVPADGVLLATLGYVNAPADFSVPATAVVVERVDQTNTVVAILTAPGGVELAAYFRRTLPEAGWTITEDGNNSLLFERGEVHGAFTASGAESALAIRYDKRS